MRSDSSVERRVGCLQTYVRRQVHDHTTGTPIIQIMNVKDGDDLDVLPL